MIAAGDVSRVRALLGRPFAIPSTPASGRGYGTRYTVPTINLAPYSELLPANGVYITSLTVGAGASAETFDAVTNVGNRPTFGADSFTVESHLLNFHPIDLNEDTPLTLAFLHRLRAEMRWPNPEALREQIGRDVAKAKRYFSLCRAVASKRRSGRSQRGFTGAVVPCGAAAGAAQRSSRPDRRLSRRNSRGFGSTRRSWCRTSRSRVSLRSFGTRIEADRIGFIRLRSDRLTKASPVSVAHPAPSSALLPSRRPLRLLRNRRPHEVHPHRQRRSSAGLLLPQRLPVVDTRSTSRRSPTAKSR